MVVLCISLLHKNIIEGFYESSRQNIMKDFEMYNENGSWWIFQSVVDFQLHTGGIKIGRIGYFPFPTPQKEEE